MAKPDTNPRNRRSPQNFDAHPFEAILRRSMAIGDYPHLDCSPSPSALRGSRGRGPEHLAAITRMATQNGCVSVSGDAWTGIVVYGCVRRATRHRAPLLVITRLITEAHPPEHKVARLPRLTDLHWSAERATHHLGRIRKALSGQTLLDIGL